MKAVEALAPGRVSILGNPSDFYGETVISEAIDMYAYVKVEPHERLIITEKVDDGEVVEEVTGGRIVYGGSLDLIKAAVKKLGLQSKPMKIFVKNSIPRQAGLAGSAALTVAILGALRNYHRLRFNNYYLAELAKRVETEELKNLAGGQDQYVVTFGGLLYMDFRGKGPQGGIDEEPYATIEPLTDYVKDMPITVCFTGAARISGSVHAPMVRRYLQGDPCVVEGVKELGRIAREGKKRLIDNDWRRLGELMNRNHEVVKALGGSAPINDYYISLALNNGALGAKLAGAGQGGTILALCPDMEKEMAQIFKQAGAALAFKPKLSRGLRSKSI